MNWIGAVCPSVLHLGLVLDGHWGFRLLALQRCQFHSLVRGVFVGVAVGLLVWLRGEAVALFIWLSVLLDVLVMGGVLRVTGGFLFGR